MQSIKENNFWKELGSMSQENLFFKVHPELIGTVSEVRMDKVRCPCCQEESLDTWIYQESGDWLQETVLPICHYCQKDVQANSIGNSLKNKHQQVLDGDWYFIHEIDEAGFKNFETPSSEAITAKKKSVEYVKSILDNQVRNLRFSGTTGTGKTHLAKAIARTFKHEGKSVAFISANELFSRIKGMFGNNHAQERFDKQFSNFDVVVIDDVGVETNNIKEISWSSSEWVRLIDMREGKSTVYTTNFDEKALASVIGARAESRMSKNAEMIELYTPGKDFRKILY